MGREPQYSLYELPNDSISLQVRALSLSEDMSLLSSKNDELLILLYEWEDTGSMQAPLAQWSLVMPARHPGFIKTLPMNPASEKSWVLLLLIEIDDDLSGEEIEALLRPNLRKLIAAFEDENYTALGQLLGDQDMLGYRIVPADETLPFQVTLTGRHKFDKYHYVISFSPKG